MDWRKKLLTIAKTELDNLDVAHRADHGLRIYEICKIISKSYKKANLDILYAAALLHDIGYINKTHNEHSHESVKLAFKILTKIKFPKNNIPIVLKIIKEHDNYCWVKNHCKHKPKELEIKIFQDADRIESLGAIGVGRNFIWAGKYNKTMWNKNIKFSPHIIFGGNFSVLHTLNFELSAYKHLNTKVAKKIAKDKYLFTKLFIKQFIKEWK
ncbi:MAG: HD domain-containing protein [Patescibacteria group bacterium]|jgi:uncharacterized protein